MWYVDTGQSTVRKLVKIIKKLVFSASKNIFIRSLPNEMGEAEDDEEEEEKCKKER